MWIPHSGLLALRECVGGGQPEPAPQTSGPRPSLTTEKYGHFSPMVIVPAQISFGTGI
jgi:hypothetical protein